MQRTTVYLPEELQARLDAESSALSMSNRCGVAKLLESSSCFAPMPDLPVFYSDKSYGLSTS